MTMEMTLTPLEMTWIIKQWGYLPQEAVKGMREFDSTFSAAEIGKLLLNEQAYPLLNKAEMKSALSGGGFSQAEAETAVNLLYPEWKRIASMPVPRRGAATGVKDGIIYVLGGGYMNGYEDDRSNTVQQYNPETNEWSLLPTMPFHKVSLLNAAVVDTSLYLIGSGVGKYQYFTGENWKYTPNQSWERMADMSTSRVKAGLAAVKGKIHVIGGSSRFGQGAGPCVYHEVYDVATNSWKEYPPLPLACLDHTVAVVDSNIYVLGGNKQNKQFVFDTISNVWSEIAQSPLCVFGAASVVARGKIYLIGGCSEGGPFAGTFYDAVQVYDPATNTWSISPAKLSCARAQLMAAVVGDTIYAIGGSECGRAMNAGACDIVEALLVYE
ncbi:Kelch repeat-containing protein [Aneurinibacillus sp. REN35]|uniref:Kelch repeat-containing protein n=1 Tax=Aneurinibacillus sp. REN35 TaxID=3237286 RepID=UPI003527AD6C